VLPEMEGKRAPNP
jgi:hypothetical protein